MILLTTTDILRFHLSGAVASTELDFVTSYVDITGFAPGNNSGTSSGASDVTIIGSPVSGIRQVKFISIVNTDSAPVDVTVELYNGANARVLLTWTINVLDSLTYIDSEGWKVLDASGKLKVTTGGGGGGGSVTSVDFTSLKNRVSANSAQMVSADNAISNAVSIVSVAAANAVSIANAVSNALSTEIVNRISSNDATNNALSIETVNRISADNVLSNAVSVVSVAAANATQIAQAVSADLTSVKNAVSVLSQAVSVASVNAANALSVANAVSNALSVETVNRISADDALYNAVSIVSVNAANATSIANAASAAAANVSAELTSVKNVVSIISQQVSVLSARVASNSAQMVSADNAISNAVSIVSVAAANATSIAQAVSADLTSVKNTVSVLSQAVSVLSVNTANALSVANAVSNALSVETANRISAVNVVSNAVSIVSVVVASKNPIITIQEEGSNIASSPTTINFRGAGVSAKLSAGVVIVSVTTGGGGGSVTSANFASLQSVVQANSAQMTSADNAISNAVSIVSVAQAATSAAVTSINQIVSALSNQNSVDHASIRNLISIVSAAVVTNSADVTSLKNRVSANSTQMVSADNAISAVAADALSKANVVSNAISVLSATLSTAISAISTALSLKNLQITIKNQGSVLVNNPTAIDFVGTAMSTFLSTGVVKVKATAGIGGGSVTSADFTSLKDRVSVVSATVSNAISAIVANSAQMTSAVDALSARLGIIKDTKVRIVSNTQSTTGSALVDVSGMVLTVGANETWEFYGVLLISTSATTVGLRAGLSVTPLSTPRFIKFVGGSAGQSATVAGGGGQLQISGSSIMLSITGIGAAGAAIPINFNGLFNTTSAGTITLQACGIASTTASPIHIMPGTYMICKRLV